MKNQLILLFLVLPYVLWGETLIQVTIWNGTKNKIVRSEKIEIIELTEEGMKPFLTYDDPKEQFSFSLQNLSSPILIRVYYQGESYIELINSSDLKKNVIYKKIVVYDTTEDIQNLLINTGVQVTKYSDGLEVNMIYAIQNKTNPPKTIRGDLLKFHLPENAKINQISLIHEKSQMPVRANLKQINDYYILDKNIKPGNTELMIQVEIPNFIYKKKIDTFLKDLQTKSNSKILSVFLWRPEDIQPTILGGTLEEKSVPNLGKAYFVYSDESEIVLDFSKGSFLFKNPMKAYSNPIFSTPLKTMIALFLGIFILFLIIPIISTSGIRITKDA